MIRRLAVVVALLVSVGGCTGEEPTEVAPVPTPTREAVVPPAPPEAGTCHRLTYAQALDPTVDAGAERCKRPHTSRTIKVGRLDMTAQGHALAVDAARVRRQPAAECATALASYVGGTVEQRRLSMLSTVAFSPTVEASDAGEAWFRCDVVAVVAPEELGRLPFALKGILDRPDGRDRFGMCGTAKPDADDFTRVACSRPHTWRAISTVEVKAGGPGWPGRKAVESAGQEPCAEAARKLADDALNYQWGYEWPTREQWQTGRRHGICWAPA